MGITGYVVVVLGVLVVVGCLLVLRRLRAIRAGGVRVALRCRDGRRGGTWRLGIGRYRADEFVWYRVLGLTTRPTQVIARASLQVTGSRDPDATEAYAMPVAARVLRCRGTTGELELGMGSDAVTGFLSWLESTPPGRRLPHAS